MKDADTLISDAMALLDNGAAWCKGSNARTSQGIPVPMANPMAASWDVFGALWIAQKQSGNIDYGEYAKAYDIMRSRIPEYYINQDMESFNDYCSDFQQVSILFGVPITPRP